MFFLFIFFFFITKKKGVTFMVKIILPLFLALLYSACWTYVPAQLPETNVTDEYGFFNFNAILTGLGANGGYVAIPNAPNENTDGTIEAWIYPNAVTSSAPAITAKGDATNVGFMFGWTASSSLLYMRFGNTTTANTGGSIVQLSQWTHAAVTWTGGPGNYTVRFYVNGALSGSTAFNSGTWNVTSDSMTIGSSRAPFTGKNFYGLIDEVRYWSDERTAAEIRDNRFVGIGDGIGANTANALTAGSHYTGLISMYNFNIGGSAPDYIGGYNGYFRSGVTAQYAPFAPQPIPYNFALYRPAASPTSYVAVPHNSVFDRTSAGTVEMWVYTTTGTTAQWFINKGSSVNVSFGFGMASTNRLVIRFGNAPVINSTGVPVPVNRWVHAAASWSGAPGNYLVKFYVDGKQSGPDTPVPGTWNLSTDPLTMGIALPFSSFGLLGYMDEVRIWSDVRTADEIKQCMFASGRSLLPDMTLIALWNFDGNLLDFSQTAGIDGSFSTGGANDCRFSSFRNENMTGALSTSFIAHPTVLNMQLVPNPFPGQFIMHNPLKPINDQQTTRDTVYESFSNNLLYINVFVSIQHTYMSDLNITLRAPNGVARDLCSGNGSNGDNMLTILLDGSTQLTTPGFFPPWSNRAAPEAPFGNFGGTNTQGNWILEITDGQNGDTGILVGWGLRVNRGINVVDPVSGNVPERFHLYQNYPNPFNPVTTIRFDLAKNSDVKIRIYDILGREVRTLVNEFKNAGAYEVKFDASNIASGTYFYKIEARQAGSSTGDPSSSSGQAFVDIKKMVLVK